jgi:hypothetical protein
MVQVVVGMALRVCMSVCVCVCVCVCAALTGRSACTLPSPEHLLAVGEGGLAGQLVGVSVAPSTPGVCD